MGLREAAPHAGLSPETSRFESRALREYAGHTHAHDPGLSEARGGSKYRDPTGIAISLFTSHRRNK